MIIIQGMRTGKTALLKVQRDIIQAKEKYYNKTGIIPNEIRMSYKEYEFIEAYYSSLIEFKSKLKNFDELMKEMQETEPYIYGMKIIIDDSIEGFEVVYND